MGDILGSLTRELANARVGLDRGAMVEGDDDDSDEEGEEGDEWEENEEVFYSQRATMQDISDLDTLNTRFDHMNIHFDGVSTNIAQVDGPLGDVMTFLRSRFLFT
mgnify:CR=1 FL=1